MRNELEDEFGVELVDRREVWIDLKGEFEF